MRKSWGFAAGRAGTAAIACWALLSACSGSTGHPAAGLDATRPPVMGRAPAATSPAITRPSPPFSYPPAPPGAAAWPRCQPGQLSAALVTLGAATGHVGAEVVLRNVSAAPCHLAGFPGLRMLSASGAPLRTTTHWGGSFLFPAISPRLVGLRTSQTASFDLAYTDIPTARLPLPRACPAAATLAIIPPGDVTSLRAPAKIAPCEGELDVSPVVPGTTPIAFR